jgi:hypothetical protein
MPRDGCGWGRRSFRGVSAASGGGFGVVDIVHGIIWDEGCELGNMRCGGEVSPKVAGFVVCSRMGYVHIPHICLLSAMVPVVSVKFSKFRQSSVLR